MVNDLTPNLGLQLPHPTNDLAEDVLRLRAALTALDTAVAAKASSADITAAINAVIDAAPGALDTLNELAAALGDDPNFAATIAGQIGAIQASLASVQALAEAAMPANRIASGTVLGGVKVGANLVIDETGVLSAPGASSGTQTFEVQDFTPTAGQTSFTVTGGYVPGQIEVLLNGVEMMADDYTATNGVHVVLATGAGTTDTLRVRKWASFSTALIATQAEAEAGEQNTKVMTSLRVKQAIAVLAGSKLIRSARTSNTVLGVADNGKLIDITSGTFTQTFAAVATLGSGWFCYIRNSGTGDITLDPNGSETIDGLTSYIMYPGEVRLVQCDGATLRTVVLNSFYKVFTASGNFIKPPGYKSFSGLLWGGGASGASAYKPGTGGGGGACNPFHINQGLISTTQSVVIGAGGTQVSDSESNGVDGGSSSFGSLVTAGGGARGMFDSDGGQGGSVNNFLYSAGTYTGGLGGTFYSGKFFGQLSYFGGGGGGGCNFDGTQGGDGGNSVFGGGGGGGRGNLTFGGGGVSTFGGAGGAAPGGFGTAPGGGGACGGMNFSASGAGARGELRIWGVI